MDYNTVEEAIVVLMTPLEWLHFVGYDHSLVDTKHETYVDGPNE